jgi:hypothetical protein
MYNGHHIPRSPPAPVPIQLPEQKGTAEIGAGSWLPDFRLLSTVAEEETRRLWALLYSSAIAFAAGEALADKFAC